MLLLDTNDDVCAVSEVVEYLHGSCDGGDYRRSLNQWASRHSARKVPLNDSTNALSVGLPGREKSIFTPF